MYIRAFIAIPLSPAVKKALAGIQGALKITGADVSWVSPDNLHLTLKFLGEIKENRIERIVSAMHEAAASRAAYPIRIASLGAFPSTKAPRVIWAGIDERGRGETKALAERLEAALAVEGVPKERRPFSSHITIGRVRSPKGTDALERELTAHASPFPEAAAHSEAAECTAEKIVLYKSTLTPNGSLYEPLRTLELTK